MNELPHLRAWRAGVADESIPYTDERFLGFGDSPEEGYALHSLQDMAHAHFGGDLSWVQVDHGKLGMLELLDLCIDDADEWEQRCAKWDSEAAATFGAAAANGDYL